MLSKVGDAGGTGSRDVDSRRRHTTLPYYKESLIFVYHSKSILARTNIPRSEIDEIIGVAHLNGKVDKDMLSKAMAVKGWWTLLPVSYTHLTLPTKA